MLKKVSYLILGFILMFSFYDEVFGADQYCDMGKDKYEQLCGENPIAVYRNTAVNSSGSCSGGSDGSKCGGEIKTTVNMVTSQELKEKGSDVIFNEACNCEAEEAGYHVLVLIDSSNSMELGNKFDAVKDGQINLTPDSTAKKAAQDAINGWDPSYGAIYYFNPSTATNKWIWSRPMTVTIGRHRFCK